jgi:hypothetical protein
MVAMKPLLIATALAFAAPALAQTAPQGVTLESKIYVAREVTDASGKKSNKLFDPDKAPVTPGEALVVMLEYRNGGARPAAGFVIDNPIPGAVSFTGVEQPWATVSIDGGKSYGTLASLKVKGADGTMRPAIPSDVTHVRWKFAQPIAPGAGGRVMFFGTVK